MAIKSKSRKPFVDRRKSVLQCAQVLHELRTPLQSLSGLIELLGNESESHSDHLRQMRSVVSMMQEITNGLMDVYEMENRKIQFNNEPVSLVRFLSDFSDYMSIIAQRNQLESTILIDGPLPGHILIDSARLKQLLSILISNAAKYTHKGGFRLHVKYDQGHLYFDVIDTGLGIRPEDIDKILKPFGRAHPFIKGGTGLGLPIAQALVKALDGEFSILSEVGKATHVMVSLPVKAIDSDAKYSHHTGDIQVSLLSLPLAEQEFVSQTLECHEIDYEILSGDLSELTGRYNPNSQHILICSSKAFKINHITPIISRFSAVIITGESLGMGNCMHQSGVPYIQMHNVLNIKMIQNMVDLCKHASMSQHIMNEENDISSQDTKLNIFIVDDDEVCLNVSSQILINQGHHVENAGSGQSLKQLFKQNRHPDLVILDNRLPDTEGLVLSRWLRIKGYRGKIYIVTGSLSGDFLEQFTLSGADRYYLKPVTNLPQLVNNVRNYRCSDYAGSNYGSYNNR